MELFEALVLTPAGGGAAEDLPRVLVVEELAEAELLRPLGELVHHGARGRAWLAHVWDRDEAVKSSGGN